MPVHLPHTQLEPLQLTSSSPFFCHNSSNISNLIPPLLLFLPHSATLAVPPSFRHSYCSSLIPPLLLFLPHSATLTVPPSFRHSYCSSLIPPLLLFLPHSATLKHIFYSHHSIPYFYFTTSTQQVFSIFFFPNLLPLLLPSTTTPSNTMNSYSSLSQSPGSRECSDQSFDYMFKLLIIGNSSVGKTSFLFRYCDNSFTSAFVSTVGIDFKVSNMRMLLLTMTNISFQFQPSVLINFAFSNYVTIFSPLKTFEYLLPELIYRSCLYLFIAIFIFY